MDLQAHAQLSPEQLMPRAFFLPFIQDNGQGQLPSILLFRKLVTVLLEENKKALKTHMRRSLLPLFFYCHDENPQVAEVRTRGLLVCPSGSAASCAGASQGAAPSRPWHRPCALNWGTIYVSLLLSRPLGQH